MPVRTLSLDADPSTALAQLREASREHPVLVFKKSPICATSFAAEDQLERWLASLHQDDELAIARVDVLAQKPLARGLTAELGIAHASPQALWFQGGELAWHGSHHLLTAERFAELHAGQGS